MSILVPIVIFWVLLTGAGVYFARQEPKQGPKP